MRCWHCEGQISFDALIAFVKCPSSATSSLIPSVLAKPCRPSTAPAGPRDFARLNKAALSRGLVTAKEQRAFREVHGGFVRRPSTAAATGRRPRTVSLPGPDHVYGVPTPPPEDLNAVLS